jgi:hypothetical protein
MLEAAAAVAVLVTIEIRLPAVQDRLVRAAIGRRVASQPSERFEKDALPALACGTASPVPHPARAKHVGRQAGIPR